jgi:phage terminase Nu1 subunit (DNA packaging protein)
MSPPLPNQLPEVSGPTLARVLGIAERTVRELVKAGIVVRARRRGLYRLEESVCRYCERLRQTASQRGGEASLQAMREERIRLTREQADAQSLKNMQLRSELLEAAAVEAEWSDVLRHVRAGVLAVPSRCAQRLPHLSVHDISELDAEVRAALTELGGGTG